jgi:hypothetical protein
MSLRGRGTSRVPGRPQNEPAAHRQPRPSPRRTKPQQIARTALRSVHGRDSSCSNVCGRNHCSTWVGMDGCTAYEVANPPAVRCGIPDPHAAVVAGGGQLCPVGGVGARPNRPGVAADFW